jgi:SRSO17 transposase
MPVVPSSLDRLLFLFREGFSAPTFQTFRMLVVGFVCRVGEHTVCGMLQGARLERSWHHSRAHAFFAEREWCPDTLGLLLLDFLVATFVAAGAPIRLAVDDSLFHRAGKQVYGAAWQYDGSVPQGAGRQSGYGNNWVSLCLIVRLPFMRRAVGLPVLSRLWRPDPEAKQATAAKRKPNPQYPTKPKLAREMLDLVIARFPDRAIELVGDSAYATKAFAGVPARVSITSRLKSNAQLYAPKPPRTGKRGQPAKKGNRLPKLKAIADDPQTVWEPTEVTRSGKRQTVLCHTFQCLWYDVWGQRPVRVVLVKASNRTAGYDIALITMDMHSSPAQIIERYDERWAIEVSYEDAKQITGVGQARNRVKKAVERTVPFGFLCQTLTITWYALYGRAQQDVKHRRQRSPWYRQKRFPSYQDMLSRLRRAVIAAQYLPVTPSHSTQQEISRPAPALKTVTG